MKESFNEMDSNLERDGGHHAARRNDSSLTLFFCSFYLFSHQFWFFLYFLCCVFVLYVHTVIDLVSSACVYGLLVFFLSFCSVILMSGKKIKPSFSLPSYLKLDLSPQQDDLNLFLLFLYI